MKLTIFLAALLLADAASAARPAPQATTETDTEIRFANQKLELRFSRKTGRWLALYDLSNHQQVMNEGQHLASVVLTTGGQKFNASWRVPWAESWSSVRVDQGAQLADTVSVGPQAKLVDWHEQKSGDMVWLTLETEEGGWRIQQLYGMKPGDDTVTRRLRLTWNGENETLLRFVDLRTPCPSPVEGTILEAPGYPAVLHQRLDRLPAGTWSQLDKGDAAGQRAGLLAFRHGDSNLLIWGFDKAIPSEMLLDRGDWGVWVTHRLLASNRLQKGQTMEAGTQYVRLEHGDFKAALRRFQRFWDEAGVRRIGKTPPWGLDARIYEVHIGTWTWGGPHAPYLNIAALTNDLPRIAGLGFNIVQMMPAQPYPCYAVHDYLDIDTHYAPEADLRRMVARAHELGLKVLLDVVMHGVIDKRMQHIPARFDIHPYVTEHPDWFSRTEDGQIAQTYSWAFDHASPSFQQFIVKVFSQYVSKLDVDGFRVDALTWNFFPNWAKDLPRPAYQSFYGGVPMFEAVREQVCRIKPEILFYTETQGPIYNTSFDLSYNYDEQPFYLALLPLVSKRGYVSTGPVLPRKISARELADWLEMRQLAFPAGWRKVHHADSHDSYSWGNLGLFRSEAFGVGGGRLLFAYSAFLDGGVMTYVGAEKGSEDFYRKVLALRESIPALREGTCDYTAVRPGNDRVLAPVRRYGKAWALPVLSFSAEPISTELPLGPLGLDPERTYTLTEAFSGAERVGKGKDLNRLSVQLPPYAVQVWTAKEGGK